MDLVQIFDQLSCCCLNEFFHFFNSLFLPRTACRRDTPWTFPTRTKLAENLWNTFGRLHATWISVEPRSLLVTRHDPSTFRKIGSKNAICTNFWNCSKSLKKLDFSTFQVYLASLPVQYQVLAWLLIVQYMYLARVGPGKNTESHNTSIRARN